MVEGRRGAFSASVTPLVNPKDPIPMTTIVKSVVGALLAVLGLVLTVIGAWFATQLSIWQSSSEPHHLGQNNKT